MLLVARQWSGQVPASYYCVLSTTVVRLFVFRHVRRALALFPSSGAPGTLCMRTYYTVQYDTDLEHNSAGYMPVPTSQSTVHVQLKGNRVRRQ